MPITTARTCCLIFLFAATLRGSVPGRRRQPHRCRASTLNPVRHPVFFFHRDQDRRISPREAARSRSGRSPEHLIHLLSGRNVRTYRFTPSRPPPRSAWRRAGAMDRRQLLSRRCRLPGAALRVEKLGMHPRLAQSSRLISHRAFPRAIYGGSNIASTRQWGLKSFAPPAFRRYPPDEQRRSRIVQPSVKNICFPDNGMARSLRGSKSGRRGRGGGRSGARTRGSADGEIVSVRHPEGRSSRGQSRRRRWQKCRAHREEHA